MKFIKLEWSLTLFICTHFWFVYGVRSAALIPPVHVFFRHNHIIYNLTFSSWVPDTPMLVYTFASTWIKKDLIAMLTTRSIQSAGKTQQMWIWWIHCTQVRKHAKERDPGFETQGRHHQMFKQGSPPAWTQEAYHPPRSKYSLCCFGSRGGGGSRIQPDGGRVPPGRRLDGKHLLPRWRLDGVPPPRWRLDGVPPCIGEGWMGVPTPPVDRHTDRQTYGKLLPSLVLRTRAVNMGTSLPTKKNVRPPIFLREKNATFQPITNQEILLSDQLSRKLTVGPEMC